MYVRPYTMFSTLHPALLFLYAVGAPILTMMSGNGWFVAASLICAIFIHGFYMGAGSIWGAVKTVIPLFLIITLFNMITNQRGDVVLFQIASRRFTLESLSYGMMCGCMLASVVIWFRCFQAILPNHKFLYLFGRRFQTCALLLSMILKLFPETHYKIRCIQMAQNSAGNPQEKSLKQKLSEGMTKISCLLEWSMEDSIETADSMKARGYGERKRSSYEQYDYTGSDWVMLCFMIALIIGGFVGYIIPAVVFWMIPAGMEFGIGGHR